MDLLDTLEFLKGISDENYRSLVESGVIPSRGRIQSLNELEKALGIKLLTGEEGLSLSSAGRIFAENSEEITRPLSTLVRKCRNIQQGNANTITIQDLPFPLLFDKKLNAAVKLCTGESLAINVEFINTDKNKTIDAVKNHTVDFGFYADPRCTEAVKSSLEGIGIGLLPLHQERFTLRVESNHPLATKSPLKPLDLLDYQLVVSSSAGMDMLRELIEKAYERFGLIPDFTVNHAATYAGFYMTPLRTNCQLTDESTKNALEKMENGTIFRYFDDPSFGFTRYLIYDNEACSSTAKLFIDKVASMEA